jgi:hypothetical protein
MAEIMGMDMWSYTSPSGKSLKKAFDELLPYISKDKEWEGPQIKDFDFEDGYTLLVQGYRFGCKKCDQTIKNLAGDKAPRLLINLLY